MEFLTPEKKMKIKKKKKNACRLKRFFRKIFRKAVFTSAIIVAGGSSTRFGGQTPKQFLFLAGMPVVVHTLLAFEKSSLIDEIVVVCRPGEENLYHELADRYAVTKFRKAVEGGDTRQRSALRGVEATDTKARYVLIHDAARPLVREETIRDVALAAHDHRAACAATPCRDTVKIVSEDGFIERTEERSHVYLAATPQGFYKPLYLACALSAEKEKIEVTDDASLLEAYHYPVRIVDCGGPNGKITTPEDLFAAEALFQKAAGAREDKEEK